MKESPDSLQLLRADTPDGLLEIQMPQIEGWARVKFTKFWWPQPMHLAASIFIICDHTLPLLAIAYNVCS